MNKKRLADILWERDNALEKFKLNAWEYFNEMLPCLEDYFVLKEAPEVADISLSPKEEDEYVRTGKLKPKKKKK